MSGPIAVGAQPLITDPDLAVRTPVRSDTERPGWLSGFSRVQRYVLAAIAGVLFVAYTTYAWARHAKYETTGFDLGIFDQVVRAYAHFSAPTSPLKGVGYNILGDHFHPILVVLAPLYWIWDDPRVLLTVQAALFAVSIVPVATFVQRRFGPVVALLAAFAYGAGWPLQRAVHFDFHEIAFAVPLIALLIDAMDRRRDRLVVLCCLLLLLVREDMGALVALVGVLVAARRPLAPDGRRRSLRLGAALSALGLVGYWLATGVVIPALGPQGFTYWTFTQLGPDPGSALVTMLTRPWQVLELMVTPDVKWHTLVSIFLPLGFLSLLSPYVILTAPFLAERMLNDRELLWETNFHYTSVIAPILIMAAADAVARLAARFPEAFGPHRLRLSRRVRVPSRWAGTAPATGLRRLGLRRLVGRVPVGLATVWVSWCVACVAVGLWTRNPDYPISGLWSGRVWQRDLRWEAVNDTLPLIPPGQCVEADNQMAPQLTSRDYVTRVTFSRGLATWIVLDLSQKDTGWQSPPPAEALEISQDKGYQVVVWNGPVVLLHKNQAVAPICRGLF